MKKLSLFLAIFALFITFSPALADDEVKNLTLDIKAKGYSQTSYQDNLQSQDIIFSPTNRIQLKLTIHNYGNRNQTNIKISQLLPDSVTSDFNTGLIIPQIAAGQDYVKDIVLTIKDKQFIPSYLNQNSLRFSLTSDAGSSYSDTLSFYTSGGAKSSSTTTATSNIVLPATGPESTIVLGSLIASAIGLASLKLRQLARGY